LNVAPEQGTTSGDVEEPSPSLPPRRIQICTATGTLIKPPERLA